MKKLIWLSAVIVSVLLVLGFGYWLIPEREELALIRMKSLDFESARRELLPVRGRGGS